MRSLIVCLPLAFAATLVGCNRSAAPEKKEPAAPSSAEPKKPADGKKTADVKTAPTISATPNPVMLGSEKFGTTSITWSTGDASVGEVYVVDGSGKEKLFAGNRGTGSLDAAWIGKGNYEFRLYEGKERAKLLASVTVVGKR